MLRLLRQLRHGPLKALGPLWNVLGRCYRWSIKHFGRNLTISMMIGPYGPFKLDARYAFSDLKNWGRGKNECFFLCVEEGRRSRCMIDIGAHVGFVSLPLARVGLPSSTIFAFEPSAINRALLEKHVLANGIKSITVVDALVGEDERNDVPFYEAASDSGLNTIAPRGTKPGFHATSKRQLSLDDFCDTNRLAPDLIKIDVEGAEIGVLNGARRVIQRSKPTIYLSVHPRQIAELGHTIERLMSAIHEIGYRMFDANNVEVLRPEGHEYILRPNQK